jgi:hypothetical protein
MPVWTIWKLAEKGLYRLHFQEGAEFFIDQTARRIWGVWWAPLTFEDAAVFLLGPVLGFALQLRGKTCLHGSAVAVDGRVLVLVGPSGSGKSTTAAALARRGYPVLTDDVVVLTDCATAFLVHPGYPRLRLWPDAVGLLCGAPDALPLLTPTWDKRYLDLTASDHRFQEQPLPLSVLYELGARSRDRTAPSLHSLSVREGLMVLLANQYHPLPEVAFRTRDFRFLGPVATRVPMRRVIPHQEPDRLGPLCDLLLADCQALSCPRSSDEWKADTASSRTAT